MNLSANASTSVFVRSGVYVRVTLNESPSASLNVNLGARRASNASVRA